LIKREFGNTGLMVSALGFGAGQIGDPATPEAEISKLLNLAIDAGITLIDTARGYGQSEERIGRHLAHRRSEFLLSTKVGYGVPGMADWTYDCVEAGVNLALNNLKTDVLDIVHLHSCPAHTMLHNGVIEALENAREKGKVRVIAYSGENQDLTWAIDSGRFGSVECSVNIFDQASAIHTLPAANSRGLGIIGKRPLGNAPWRHTTQPHGQYCETYWGRMHALAYNLHGMPWDEVALRFATSAPNVSSAIVGTASATRLAHNIALVEKGALTAEMMTQLQARYAQLGTYWPGEV
jgi:aryl-alcohol dehydrogenase-like predicted oxidoreductase